LKPGHKSLCATVVLSKTPSLGKSRVMINYRVLQRNTLYESVW